MRSLDEISLTVVIPCYNSGSTLTATCKSLAAQTDMNFYVIVVNDGSDEELTIHVLSNLNQKYPDLDLIVADKVNGGLASARNTGVNCSHTNFTCFLDADDTVSKNYIENIKLILTKRYVDKNNNLESIFFTAIEKTFEQSGCWNTFFCPWTQVIANRIGYNIIGPTVALKKYRYDEAMTDGFEDWELNLRLHQAGYNFEKIKGAVLYYRVSSNGMLRKHSLNHTVKIKSYIFNKLLDNHRRSIQKNNRKTAQLILYWWFIYATLFLRFTSGG